MIRASISTAAGCILAGLVLYGCDPQQPEEPAGPVEFRVDPNPLVVIGVVDGAPEYLFDGIVSVHLTEGELLAVADWGAMAVRLYDLSGAFVRQLGRPGEGPGEFQTIAGTWLAEPDTIHAYHYSYPRVTTYLLDGTFAETQRLEPFVGHADHVIGSFPDGGFVLGQTDFGQSAGSIVPDLMSYDEYGPDGHYVGRVAQEAGIRRYEAESRAPVRMGGIHPLTGWARAQTFGDSLYFSDGMGVLRVWSREAGLARSINLPASGVTAEEAWRDLYRAREARGMETSFDGIPRVDAAPTAADFLIDDLGLFWVKRFDPGVDAFSLGGYRGVGGGDWWVIDPDGEVQATVSLPPELILKQVRGSYLVGLSRDELDVERVLVHRLLDRDDR